MIYNPEKGAMWDPSVLWHDGKYYAFMMYDKDGRRGLCESRYCLMASSTDGVHWKDEGIVNEERELKKDTRFFKCFVGRCGNRFVMNHGVYRKKQDRQDTLRFYESVDLKNWKYLYSSNPDPQWYLKRAPSVRWDHMYIVPKKQGNSKAGYFGYIVSMTKNGRPPAVGMMQSNNGTKWKALPPAKIEWGNTLQKNLEFGGCEQIGEKYYLIGGAPFYFHKGYSMYTMVADSPRGPFRPDVDAYQLCGSVNKCVTWLAAWVRGNNELLISNSVSMRPHIEMTWLLPLRKAVVDKSGHLHLGWWKGNEALKGKPIPLKKNVRLSPFRKTDDYATTFLNKTLDLKTGIVLEGRIKAVAASQQGHESSAGFLFERNAGRSLAVLLGIDKPENRRTRIGHLRLDPDGKTRFRCEDTTDKGCATVTGIENGKEHLFRLLIREQVFELYIDDMLMQTYVYKLSGRLGFVTSNAKAEFSNLRAWQMQL